MASNSLPPVPKDQIGEIYSWREWFNNLGTYIQKAQTGGNVWTILQGGTGASNANDARTNLGIGTIGTQNANNVAITGGSISGTTLNSSNATITGGSVAYTTITNTPIGSFFDTTTQTASANTPTTVTFNNTDISSNVSLGTPTSRVVVTKSGKYNIFFSVQASNTAATADNVYAWFRINGTDATNSAGVIAVPPKVGIVNGSILFSWSIPYSLNANDYIELVWLTVGGTSSLTSVAASTSPAIPAAPSAAISVDFLTNL